MPIMSVDDIRKYVWLENGELMRLDARYKFPKIKKVKNTANTKAGYCIVKAGGKRYYYHRLVWQLYYNKMIPENYEIDHIDGNKLNNKIENLRIVSSRENKQNQVVHRNGHLYGCYFSKKTGKWVALIRINGKRINLGAYSTELHAHNIYKIACSIISKYDGNNVKFRKTITEMYR